NNHLFHILDLQSLLFLLVFLNLSTLFLITLHSFTISPSIMFLFGNLFFNSLHTLITSFIVDSKSSNTWQSFNNSLTSKECVFVDIWEITSSKWNWTSFIFSIDLILFFRVFSLFLNLSSSSPPLISVSLSSFLISSICSLYLFCKLTADS